MSASFEHNESAPIEWTFRPEVNPAGSLKQANRQSESTAEEFQCAAKKPTAEITDDLHLVTFSRAATGEERKDADALVATAPSPKEGLEDLLWALLNAHEFVFNH